MTWSKISKIKPIFTSFLDILRRIYANVLFLETLKKAPTYLKFLIELLLKKGETGDASVAPIGEPTVQSYKAGHHLSC